MNTPDPYRHLRRQLSDAAAHVRLSAGSELAAVRAAHRRRNRTRTLVGASAALAVGTGTVVAVQQLGQTSPDQLTTGDGGATVPDDPIAAEPAPPTTAAAQAVEPVGTVAPGLPHVDAQPAVAVESRYTWNAMSAEAAEASLSGWHGRVPGIVISTAPGSSGGVNQAPRQEAYYTADGVTFERLDVGPSGDLSRGGRLFADGESIYRVGTAPGVAASDPNPMRVEYSADRGATWATIDLPVDTHELRGVEGVMSNHQIVVTATDAGPVIAVTRWADLDYGMVTERLGTPYVQPTEGGVVAVDPGCAQTSGTTVPLGGVPVTEPRQDPFASCPTTEYTWADLGLPANVHQYVGGAPSTRLFRVVDGAPVEIAPPDGTTALSVRDSGSFTDFAGSAGTIYRLGADLQWQREELPEAVGWSGREIVASETHRFTMALAPENREVLAASDGGQWTYASIDALLDPFQHARTVSQDATTDGFAQALLVSVDAVGQQGGVSLQAGSVTISRATMDAPLTVRDTASGTEITGWSERWRGGGAPATTALSPVSASTTPMAPTGTAPGHDTVDIVASDGTVLATFSADEYYSLYPDGENAGWLIATTTDGVHVAVEPVADLLGVAASEIRAVRINTVGRQVIATVTLAEEISPGVRAQRVLIGTPND